MEDEKKSGVQGRESWLKQSAGANSMVGLSTVSEEKGNTHAHLYKHGVRLVYSVPDLESLPRLCGEVNFRGRVSMLDLDLELSHENKSASLCVFNNFGHLPP